MGVVAAISGIVSSIGATLGGLGLVGTGLEGAALGAGIGALGSKLEGGNPLTGALTGGLTGGAVGGFGGLAGDALGIGSVGGDALVGAAAGAGGSALTGGNVGTGALTGGLGGAAAGALGVGGADTAGSPSPAAGQAAASVASPVGAASDLTAAVPAGAELSAADTSALNAQAALGASGSTSNIGTVLNDSASGDTAALGGGGLGGSISGGTTGGAGGGAGIGAGGPTAGGFTTADVASGADNGLFPLPPVPPSLDASGNPIFSPSGAPVYSTAGDAQSAATQLAADQAGGVAPQAGGAQGAGQWLNNNGRLLGVGLAGVGLARNLLTPSNDQNTDAITALAKQSATQGQTLQNYLTSGTLPPAVQASVDAATRSGITAIKSKYASMGVAPGSSGELQDISNLKQNSVIQGATLADQLLQQGISETQMSGQLYNALVSQQNTLNQETTQAIGGLAAALAGGGVRLGTGQYSPTVVL